MDGAVKKTPTTTKLISSRNVAMGALPFVVLMAGCSTDDVERRQDWYDSVSERGSERRAIRSEHADERNRERFDAIMGN